jgi:hypothetical protein
MGVFETIPATGSMHVKDIAAAAGADEALLSKLPYFLPTQENVSLERQSPNMEGLTRNVVEQSE